MGIIRHLYAGQRAIERDSRRKPRNVALRQLAIAEEKKKIIAKQRAAAARKLERQRTRAERKQKLPVSTKIVVPSVMDPVRKAPSSPNPNHCPRI